MELDHGMPAGYLSEVFSSYQGEGLLAGQRHLFVRFSGCNIRCRYCDTPDSLRREPVFTVDYPDGQREVLPNPVAAECLAAMVRTFCRQDPRLAGLAITGGEPMLQQRFLRAWLGRFPPSLPCLLETNGLLSSGLAELLPYLSVVSADLKLPSTTGELAFWEQHLRFLRACKGVEVYVKMPVDDATDPEEVRRGARVVALAAPRATLFVQPVTEQISGVWRISESRLLRMTAVAAMEGGRARLRPQLHKLLGLR